MLKKVFIGIFVCMLIGCSYSKVLAGNDLEISNKYFSFIMPNETKNTYTVKKEDNGIYICEKISDKSDMGGFAFGLKIYSLPKDYADMDDAKKIGELTDKNGKIYDLVLFKPTEIRYGDGEEIEKNFTRLYDCTDNLEIKGINGYKYYKNRGMKGEDLYKEILKKYKTAMTEKWSSAQYNKEDLGYIYPTLAEKYNNLSDKIGYTFYDINGDDIDELIIGEINNNNLKGIIYDVYTMVDRKPKHVFTCGRNAKFFVSLDRYLWNELPPEPKENSTIIYILKKNSTEMTPYIMFTYNANINKKNPWYITYGLYGKPGIVTKKVFNERKNFFKEFKRFNYTPLSKFE